MLKSMLAAIVVVRGDGRVLHCNNRSDAIAAMQQAQVEGDRYASIHGVTSEECAAIERDAGYTIGASNRDCYGALQQHAAPVPRVDN